MGKKIISLLLDFLWVVSFLVLLCIVFSIIIYVTIGLVEKYGHS